MVGDKLVNVYTDIFLPGYSLIANDAPVDSSLEWAFGYS